MRSPRTRATRCGWPVEAVFKSWNGRRAIDYRRQNKISDDLGTAVNIAGDGVRQPRGRLGHRGGVHAGPVHRREGALRRLPGERAGRGRGGGHPQHAPTGQARATIDPDSYTRASHGDGHARAATTTTCATSSSRSRRGTLWILQTRVGKRTAFGEWVIAYDMLEEGLIDEDAALLRVDANRLEELFKRRVTPRRRRRSPRD